MMFSLVFEFSNLIFSDMMKSLVESKNLTNVLNQVRQITRDHKCSPNKPLFFQFLWTQGCLPSGGMAVGGLTIFMMIPGYTYETAKELALQHDINMQTGEEESDEDFRSLLGKAHTVPPVNKHEGFIMLQGMTEFLVLMADGPCVASSGYALAAKLWKEYSQEIYQLTRSSQEPHFLLRLLTEIDKENHLLFKALFQDIQEAGNGSYCHKMSMVHKQDEEISRIFDNLVRGRTHDLKLPDNFLLLLESNQRCGKGGGGGGGGGGGDAEPPTKRMRITQGSEDRNTQKQSPDNWSAPSSVTDPVATFFPNKGNNKVNRERWMKIKFKHHQKLPSSDEFAQTHLCLDYQVAGYFKFGTKCNNNHRSCKQMLAKGDAAMKKNVLLVDKLVESIN